MEYQSTADAIIVLGAQVKETGEPSIQLTLRLEAALAAYQRQSCILVVCGAKGDDEPQAEAYVMRDWLILHGVEASDILTDPNSFNTRENISNAAALLPDNIETVLIVTSDYHAPRAVAIAKDLGLKAGAMGSRCYNDLLSWSRNHFREALAYGKYWAVKWLGLR